ncbi:hypothetical protein CLAIMM_10023 isoform 2, partial [Cladophialophora immunda]
PSLRSWPPGLLHTLHHPPYSSLVQRLSSVQAASTAFATSRTDSPNLVQTSATPLLVPTRPRRLDPSWVPSSFSPIGDSEGEGHKMVPSHGLRAHTSAEKLELQDFNTHYFIPKAFKMWTKQ